MATSLEPRHTSHSPDENTSAKDSAAKVLGTAGVQEYCVRLGRTLSSKKIRRVNFGPKHDHGTGLELQSDPTIVELDPDSAWKYSIRGPSPIESRRIVVRSKDVNFAQHAG